MAINYPGEFEIRINYSVLVGGLTSFHQQRLSFDADVVGSIGEAFSAWFPIARDLDDSVNLLTKLSGYLDDMEAYYPTQFDVINQELWKYAVGTFDATWQAAEGNTRNGTSVSPIVQDSEQILVFRSDAGGLMRVHYMQGVVTRGASQVLPLGNSDLDTLADAFLATNNVWKARDGGWPKAFIGMHPGENEALFKKRFR